MVNLTFLTGSTSIPFAGSINNAVLLGGGILLAIVIIALASGSGRRTLGQPRRSVPDIASLVVFALLGLAAAGYILPLFGVSKGFVVGPLLLLLVLLIMVVLGFRLVTGAVDLSGKGIFAMLLGLGILISLLVLFPKLAPEFWNAQSLQSIVQFGAQSLVSP